MNGWELRTDYSDTSGLNWVTSSLQHLKLSFDDQQNDPTQAPSDKLRAGNSVGWAGESLFAGAKPEPTSGAPPRRSLWDSAQTGQFPAMQADGSNRGINGGPVARGRGRGRRQGDNRRGKAFKALWEQVTKVGSGEKLDVQTGLAFSEMSVEDIVRVVENLPAESSVAFAISHALYYLDSRALAYLIKELARVGKMQRAFELFEWLRGLGPKHDLSSLCDVYTYTTVISLCGQQKQLRLALELVAELRGKGIQCNVHTYSALMNVCIKCGELKLALDVYKKMKADGCKPNVVTYNTLIDVYGKLGQWRKAVEVLDVVRAEGLEPEIRTYNTALIACNMCKQPLEALKVFHRLLEAGLQPISTTYTALISAYGKANMFEKAIEAYHEMVARNLERSVITYAALIGACEKANKWELALQLFHNMPKEGVAPNSVVYNSVIGVLCTAGEWAKAEEVFAKMKAEGCKADTVVFMSLLSAYDKAGEWHRISNMFENALQSGLRPDVSLYHAVINALWATGLPWAQSKAFQIFNSALRNCRARLAVQFVNENSKLEIVVQPLSVGVAVLGLYKWLIEVRSEFEKHAGFVPEQEVVVHIGRGNAGRDPSVKLVKDAVTGMFKGFSAPFSMVGSDGQSPKLSCSIWQFKDWVRNPEAFSRVLMLVHEYNQNTGPLSRDPATCQQFAAHSARCREVYKMIKDFEASHRLDFKAMGEGYIHERVDLISLAMDIGRRLNLQEEIIHDAVLLMDRVMSTGARFQEGIGGVAVAALLRISAISNQTPNHLVSTDHLDILVQFPAGSVMKLEQQIRATVGQDTAAISAMRVAKLYIDWLGYSSVGDWGHGVVRRIIGLVQSALSCPTFLNFRPSVIAAAIIYHDRSCRGWVPVWPVGLTFLTGYESLNTPEMVGAIRAAEDLDNRHLSISPTVLALGL